MDYGAKFGHCGSYGISVRIGSHIISSVTTLGLGAWLTPNNTPSPHG